MGDQDDDTDVTMTPRQYILCTTDFRNNLHILAPCENFLHSFPQNKNTARRNYFNHYYPLPIHRHFYEALAPDRRNNDPHCMRGNGINSEAAAPSSGEMHLSNFQTKEMKLGKIYLDNAFNIYCTCNLFQISAAYRFSLRPGVTNLS